MSFPQNVFGCLPKILPRHSVRVCVCAQVYLRAPEVHHGNPQMAKHNLYFWLVEPPFFAD